MVVLVLKNIRSQWFGQTDVVFERLRRVLNALAKVLIFVDEARHPNLAVSGPIPTQQNDDSPVRSRP